MSEKVTITQELANAIEEVRIEEEKGGTWDSKPIKLLDLKSLESIGGDWLPVWTILEFIRHSIENTTIYYRAVTDGYEVEETPEDKVKAHWNELKKHFDECHKENTDGIYINGQMRGLTKTLELLNIKIAGVNHE